MRGWARRRRAAAAAAARGATGPPARRTATGHRLRAGRPCLRRSGWTGRDSAQRWAAAVIARTRRRPQQCRSHPANCRCGGRRRCHSAARTGAKLLLRQAPGGRRSRAHARGGRVQHTRFGAMAPPNGDNPSEVALLRSMMQSLTKQVVALSSSQAGLAKRVDSVLEVTQSTKERLKDVHAIVDDPFFGSSKRAGKNLGASLPHRRGGASARRQRRRRVIFVGSGGIEKRKACSAASRRSRAMVLVAV